jgi:hypothetical protein
MNSSWASAFAYQQELGSAALNAAINGTNTPAAVATGTNQATAYPIVSTVTIFTTVAPGTGAVLPPFLAGQTGFFGEILVGNGQSALLLYPNGAASLNGLSAGVPVAIPPGSLARIFVSSPTEIWVR